MKESYSISKQSNFSRTLANEGSAGAYYTDLEHCMWIGKFLAFPDDEVCCLEPFIGNGAAVKQIIGENLWVKIFGVELNSEVAKATQQDPRVEKLLNADFFNGIKSLNKKFSFCFANPPYGIDQSNRNVRLERLALEKISQKIKTQGVLVYVIPFYVLKEEKFAKYLFSRYEIVHIYKFHKREYAKFQQVVIFAIRKQNNVSIKAEYENFYERIIDESLIEELPVNYEGPKIHINASYASEVGIFESLEFDINKGLSYIKNSPLTNHLWKSIEVPQYMNNDIGKPPVSLKDDFYYLLGVSGTGQGIAGDETRGDLHLQRGNVKRVKTSRIEIEPSGIRKEIVRESTAICYKIIENDGTITSFEQ